MVGRRGTRSILRANGAFDTWSSGPSTSPLGVITVLIRLALLFLFCAVFPRADAQWGVPLDCDAVDHRGDCTLYGISMVQLLANPQRYDGKRIRVVGHVHLESPDAGIYLHKEDAEHHILKNGVLVSLAEGASIDGCQDSYGVMEGLYRVNNTGHMRLWSGAITRVTGCQLLP